MLKNNILKNYSWFRVIFIGLIFLIYDIFHISGDLFVTLFTFIDILIILFDVAIYLKFFKKPSIVDVGIYILFNYLGFKIMF